MLMKLATIAVLCATLCVSLPAADFYVDPVSGSATGAGTANDPWLTIEQVIADDLIESRDWDTHPYTSSATLQTKNAGAPVKAGDTIWLRDGFHGELVLNGWYNSANITIAAEPGHTPELERVSIIGAERWVLDGLSISPEHAPTFTQQTILAIRDDGFWGPCSNVLVQNCDVFCADDSSSWTAQDWLDHHSTAFDLRGDDIEVANNTVRNIRYGISVSGANNHVHDNIINGFSGDGSCSSSEQSDGSLLGVILVLGALGFSRQLTTHDPRRRRRS